MIFSSLFKKKPSWQHQDTTIRITAISDELQLNNNEHHTILLSIANDDNSDLVRRAALIKLHDFNTFVQTSINNSSLKVRDFAAKQIEEILIGQHGITLTTQQKQQFLTNKDTSLTLLEHCLSHEQESDVIIALFEQINARKSSHISHKKKSYSHQFLVNTFTQKQNEAVQLHLLKTVEDVKVLEKILKKSCNEKIASQINKQLNEIHQLEQKPLLLAKQAQLILSKYLALKDNLDYGIFQNKKQGLDAEWQNIQGDFSYLSIEQQQLLNLKFDNINEQLIKVFASKFEAFEQQKITDKLKHDKQQAKVEFSQALHAQNQLLTTAVFENTVLDEKQFNMELSALSTKVHASVLNAKEQAVFIVQIEQLVTRLGQLGEIADSVSQATALISSVSQLTLPDNLSQLNERSQVYNQWLVEWRAIEKKTNGMLPKSIKAAQQEITSLWQTGLKSLQSEQKNVFFQQKKKLHDIKRLTEQGKYKVCFGLFSGVKENFPLLSPSQQQQLQRDFDSVNEKLTELSDWEHYIATPRKKELLGEIQNLVTAPLDNPNEQASKVKQYRHTWNSLGHAEDEVEKELNEQFNQACEEAFAPCRLFYAEQDKLRAVHLSNREAIIAEAKHLLTTLTEMQSNQAVDFKSLDGKVNKLQHKWQAAGEVDREHYKKLQVQFRETLQPVLSAITNFHQENVIDKKALISKAEALKGSDDIFKAIDEIKKLQQAWREIGFAGSNQEAKLWKKFRSINDEIFDERQQAKTSLQAEQSKQEAEFTEQLIALQRDYSNAEETEIDDISANLKKIKSFQQTAQSLLTEVIAHKPVIKAVATKLEQFIKQLETTLIALNSAEKKQSWSNLFSLLTLIANDAVTAEQLQLENQYLGLSKRWKKQLTELLTLDADANDGQRADKTLALEILAQVPSPQEFAEQRMSIQVQMLQNKMLSGATNESSDDLLTQALVEWLMLGKLSKEDLSCIERIKTIYCVA